MSMEDVHKAIAEAAAQRSHDLADPERAPSIARVIAVRDAVLASDNQALSEAFVAFGEQLPYDNRLTHYFRGSTPPPGVTAFDTEVIARIEAFAKEHGLG